MNQDFQIPKKTFLLIPAGTYRATITGLEKAVGVYGEQVKITFHVLTDDVDYTDGSVDLLAWCSTNYSEKSKLFRWARAALAGDFDPVRRLPGCEVNQQKGADQCRKECER